MAKLRFLTLPFLAAFLLVGCAEFFEFNLFEGLDPAPTPSVTDYEGEQGLDRLQLDLASDTVVEALRNDTTGLVDDIEQMLLDDYLNDGVSGTEDQEAAVLYADLNLVTTSGDLLVNNLVDLALAATTGELPPTDSITDLLQMLIPAEVRNDGAAFEAMIEGLFNANDAYILLGNSIVDQQPQDGRIDPGEGVPPSVNIGDVAQKAAVAFMVTTIASGLGLTEENAGSQLFLLLDDPSNPELAIGNGPTPDFNVQPTYLVNIMSAAGLTSLPGM